MEYHSLGTSLEELVARHRSPPAPPSIFVAYDFKDGRGARFFIDLRSALAHSPKDASIVVQNGHVDPGASWAVEVRERISKARLLVADLSMNSVEVYFECGLAWGVGRQICPVVCDETRRTFLPRWLLELQVVTFGDTTGFEELLQLVRKVADDRNARARNRCESAVPGKITVVSNDQSLLDQQNAIVRAACGQYGMQYVESPPVSPESLSTELPRDIADSSLLIINISGDFSESDLYGIFCTGAILSHPSSGVASRKLLKQVLIVAHGKRPESIKIFPDAAKRVRNVKIVTPMDLAKEVHAFAANYRRWASSQMPTDKGTSYAALPRRRRP